MISKSKVTKIILKSSSIILILCMLMPFAGCKKKNFEQISKQELVGSWISIENIYLEYYEKICYQTISFRDGGSLGFEIRSAEDNKLLRSEYGAWVIEKDEIHTYLKKWGYSDFITATWYTYVYDGKYLKCGEWTYKKQE